MIFTTVAVSRQLKTCMKISQSCDAIKIFVQGEQASLCAPIVDALPGSVVFICDLFNPPGVVGGVLLQKMTGQLVEGHNCSLAAAQVLEERL